MHCRARACSLRHVRQGRRQAAKIRELATFREVARVSNFSRAAARFGYVQSTVSAQIAALEEDLGIRLIDRLGRTIALTVAGQALLPYAEHLLELAAEARSAAVAAVADDIALTEIGRASCRERGEISVGA